MDARGDAGRPGSPRGAGARYVSGDLAGDIEDLEEHEVRASIPYDDRVKLAEKEQIIFEEAEARKTREFSMKNAIPGSRVRQGPAVFRFKRGSESSVWG